GDLRAPDGGHRRRAGRSAGHRRRGRRVSAAAELVTDDGDFVRVCRVDELPEKGAAAADINGTIVAIVRTESGDIHAVDDTCSHANVSLSEGELDGCTLECWLHGSRFD